MLKKLASFGVAATLSTPAIAEGFERIEDLDRFKAVVEDRALSRLGIQVKVTKNGDIVGRAFGQDVSGDWEWRQGYFCRSLFWGERDLGDNCQTVEVNGRNVRFTSDQGAGDSAILRLQ